jgi:hypothetical protein
MYAGIAIALLPSFYYDNRPESVTGLHDPEARASGAKTWNTRVD